LLFGRAAMIPWSFIAFAPGILFGSAADRDRIGGGDAASWREFTHQVLVHGYNVCGGTLISADKVVTAGHCCHERDSDEPVVLKSSDLEVTVGSIAPALPSVQMMQNNNWDPQQETFAVKHVALNPRYKNQTTVIWHDICILTLKGSVKLDSPSVGFLKLPSANQSYQRGTECTVVGWGLTTKAPGQKNFTGSRILRKVIVPIITNSLCADKMDRGVYISCRCQEFPVNDSMICAGEDKKGACQGDSGGPLICDNHLAGVVSATKSLETCAFFPQVYTRVEQYLPWIKENMKKKVFPDSEGNKAHNFKFSSFVFFICMGLF